MIGVRALVTSLGFTCLAASATVAGEEGLLLGDSCINGDGVIVEVPVTLEGEERPSALRTTVLFDPARLEPVGVGAAAGGNLSPAWGGFFRVDADPAAGHVDLVFQRQGRLPQPPLPAGELARLRFRARPEALAGPPLRVEIDAGRTRARDSADREAFTATGPAAMLWIRQSAPWLVVKQPGRGRASIALSELPADREVGIVRGDLLALRSWSASVKVREIESAASGPGGIAADDPAAPESGEGFFYVAVTRDPSGRSSFGFTSACQPRRMEIEESLPAVSR